MAIISGMTTSFKKEILEGVHNLDSAGDTFYIALYGSSASLSQLTTAYTSSGEVTGTGYVAAGSALTSSGVSTSGLTAYVDFNDVAWTTSTITARGALIYNSSLVGNNSVCVLDFGSDRIVSAGTFTIEFPTADSTDAMIRIT
jgi:hypothetical protein